MLSGGVLSADFATSGKRVYSTTLDIEPSVSVPIERPPSEISLNLSSESAFPKPKSSMSSENCSPPSPPNSLD